MGAAIALTGIAIRAGSDSKDLPPLSDFWRIAAEAGDPTAQRILGEFCLRGFGTAHSVQEAERWLSAAAAQGNGAAQVLLGGILAQGQVLPRDLARSVSLFGKRQNKVTRTENTI